MCVCVCVELFFFMWGYVFHFVEVELIKEVIFVELFGALMWVYGFHFSLLKKVIIVCVWNCLVFWKLSLLIKSDKLWSCVCVCGIVWCFDVSLCFWFRWVFSKKCSIVCVQLFGIFMWVYFLYHVEVESVNVRVCVWDSCLIYFLFWWFRDIMTTEEGKRCPLCAEEMDFTDQQLKPCKCGYQVVIISTIVFFNLNFWYKIA